MLASYPRLQNLLLSLSLANLIFLPLWNEILECTWYCELAHISFSPILLPATMLLVILFGFCIYGFIVLEEKTANRFVKNVLVLFLTFTFASLIIYLIRFYAPAFVKWIDDFPSWLKGILFSAFFVTAILAVIKSYKKPIFLEKIINFYKKILILLIPFLVIVFIQSSVTFFSIYTDKIEGPAPYLQTKENQPRIALLLFDELDIRATFEQRHPKLKLENLDRFKQESFYASKAYAGGPSTLISIPALLTGQNLSDYKNIAHNEGVMKLSNGETLVFNKDSESLFSRARALGLNIGINGFYHPYSKLFGRHLSAANFRHGYIMSVRDGLKFALTKNFQNFLSIFPEISLLKGNSHETPQILAATPKKTIDSQEVDQEAERLNRTQYWLDYMLNKQLNLIYIHFPYPHPPGVYDYEADCFCVPCKGSYLGNVKLVDRTIAEMKERLGQDWEQTTIILTADHWFRKIWLTWGYECTEEERQYLQADEPRVPFMIKFAHHNEPYVFEEAFSTVLVHDIILEIAQGHITNTKQLAKWLKDRL